MSTPQSFLKKGLLSCNLFFCFKSIYFLIYILFIALIGTLFIYLLYTLFACQYLWLYLFIKRIFVLLSYFK